MNHKAYHFHIYLVQADGGLLFLNANHVDGECKDALAKHFKLNGGDAGTYAVINMDTNIGRIFKAVRNDWSFTEVSL